MVEIAVSGSFRLLKIAPLSAQLRAEVRLYLSTRER
jgi:hypothetical protein